MSLTQYHIARGSRQLGVVTQAELIRRVQTCTLQQNDLYWTQGMPNWKSLGTLGLLTPYWSGTNQLSAGTTVNPSASVTSGNARPVAKPAKDGGPPCCPNCGNKNVKSARHLYLIGTRDSTTTGGSIGWGRNSNPRTWVSSRTSASRLAADLAPPEKGMGCAGIWALLVFFLVFGLANSCLMPIAGQDRPELWLLFMIPALVAAFYIARAAYRSTAKQDEVNEQEFQRKYAEWERLWYCNKCSERFPW